jgi:hypothetical protein
MKKFINNYWIIGLGALIGAVAGYFYWQQVGCSSGTCAITSKPLNSTLYGALMGGILFSSITNKTKTTQ